MACDEKTRLVKSYETATAKFSTAVSELQRKMGTSTKAEYDRLQHATEEARVKSEHGRLALEQHVATHGC
jgi:hypothetical protein